jgi:hypothetical protein
MVTSIIPGANHPEYVLDTIKMIKYPIPNEYWQDLKSEGLLHLEDPTQLSRGPRTAFTLHP